MSISILTHIIF